MMEEMNEGELTQALEDSVIQVRLQIQNLEGSTSNLRFERPAKWTLKKLIVSTEASFFGFRLRFPRNLTS